jgi:hypothetical protein
MAMNDPTFEDLSKILGASGAAAQKLVDFNLKKMIEDDHVYEALTREHPEFANLAPMFSPLSGLTYLPEDKDTGVNAWYARIARLRGVILIEECYADESDPGAQQFLFALEEFGKDRAYDSRRGFKATIVTENRITLEAPGFKTPEKKKFLGLF